MSIIAFSPLPLYSSNSMPPLMKIWFWKFWRQGTLWYMTLSWWLLEVGHFLLDKLMISREGPPFYYISWWLLEVGPLPMYYELMSRGGPPQLMECQLMIRGGPPVDHGLKLQYKTGLKSGWLFNPFTLWSKRGPTSRFNFSRGAHL